MDSLFSHAQPAPHDGIAPESAREDPREIGVWALPVPLVDALAGFLEHTHLWWPTDFTVDGGHVYCADSRVLEEDPEGEPILLGTLSTTTERDSSVFVAFAPADPDHEGNAILGLGLRSDNPSMGPTALAAHVMGSSPHPGFDGQITGDDWEELATRFASFMGAQPSVEDGSE
jgi:hypothetical protein